jgi:glycosyltransferase 2 family protein
LPKALKSVLQYVIMIALTGGLLWLSLRGIHVGEGENKTDFIWNAWNHANKGYLLLMAFFLMISHILRSERWRMLMVPSGNHVKFGNSLLSLFIGYLVNLAIPRGGEVSRCYNLFKLEKTPVEISFGTVVVERIVDVLCLVILIGISFIVEWKRLEKFISSLSFGSGTEMKIPVWLIIAVVLGAGVIVALYFFRKNERLRKIIEGFREGLLSVFRLKNKWLFLFYSLAIWVMYFLMTYYVMKAFPETQDLGYGAVLTLFAIGAIAMAAPLPGGAGSYHTLVPMGLVSLYNLHPSDATAFVFVFHAWQTAFFILFGFLSLIISYFVIRWKNLQAK